MIQILGFVITTLIGCILLTPFAWSWYKRSFGKEFKFLPGDWPIIGHMLALKDRNWFNSIHLKEKRYQDNNGLYGILFMKYPIFMTRKLAIWEDLLSSQKYIEKGIWYWVFEKVLGKGLVTSKGELWRKRRKMITPAFHFDILGEFISVMENRTMELIQFLKKYAEDESSSFEALKVTKPFSMSVICETSMGINLSLEETNDGKYKKAYERTQRLITFRAINPLYKSDFVYSFTEDGKLFKEVLQIIKGIVQEVIERRLKFRNDPNSVEAGMTKKRIFIDILLDAYEKGEIDIEGILDEVNTFVNAGYETTSTALAWCLYCLGGNHDVQDKLYKELSSFGKKSLCLEDLKQLRYLDLVIKETMRLHPTVLRIARSVPAGARLGGITFPASTIVIDMVSMNRCPEIWENPMAFIPERFEGFEEKKRSPFVYIPFSAGPRNCIGQRFAMFELKVALYHLIRAYQVTSLQKESELKETFDMMHGNEDGLILSLKNRES